MNDAPKDALGRIVARNQMYAASFAVPAVAGQPSLGLAIITCMDARINVYAALGLGHGEAHVIRNAGGVVTDDVLRSLIVSQWCLETREILVIQHTCCGMLNLDESAVAARIHEETGAPLAGRLGGFSDLEDSVRSSVARLRATPVLRAHRRIGGFIYDVDTGRLMEVSGAQTG